MLRGYSTTPIWGLSGNSAVAVIFSWKSMATYSAHYGRALNRVSLKSQRPNAKNSAVFKFRFLGQLVWSLNFAVGTSSLCHNVQRRLPDGLGKDGLSQQIRDYWINLEGDINALEPRDLCNTLISFFLSIWNARIDVWTNNVTLPAAWENGGCRSSLVKKEFKNIEEMFRTENFALHLKYVPSNENISDAPCHWLSLVRGGVGPSFKRGLNHRRLTWCLWTATVAEEGIKACCLITRLSRLRILQG